MGKKFDALLKTARIRANSLSDEDLFLEMLDAQVPDDYDGWMTSEGADMALMFLNIFCTRIFGKDYEEVSKVEVRGQID